MVALSDSKTQPTASGSCRIDEAGYFWIFHEAVEKCQQSFQYWYAALHPCPCIFGSSFSHIQNFPHLRQKLFQLIRLTEIAGGAGIQGFLYFSGRCITRGN